jgi:hypothetical protein
LGVAFELLFLSRMKTLLCALGVAAVGCAHWGTTNVADELPALPSVSSTYLAPVRPPLAPEVTVSATMEPPPPGSTVLAISRARCYSGPEDCLHALLDETRRLGGNGLFGLHPESVPRAGMSLVGSVTFDDRAPTAPPPGRETELNLGPGAVAPVDVFLERREHDVLVGGPRDTSSVESWHLVCKLPCRADIDSEGTYRLTAPALADEKPLALEPPVHDRVQVALRPGKSDWSRFWVGLGITLFAGGVTGGTTAYYFANRGTSSGLAELTVGLSILPCVFVGLEDMLLGPVRHVELAVDPNG